MRALFAACLSKILNLIPQSRKLLVFSSFPDYTDNAYALYKYIISNYTDYECVWIFSSRESMKKYSRLRKYYKFSILGLWYYCRARYVFCTHGLYSFLSLKRNDKVVNLWHGMPLKTIGSMDLQGDGKNPTKADYLIATSPFFQDIMSRSFNGLDKDKVLVVGQPRNDLLFEPTDFFVNRGLNREEYTSVGVWLPTYRSSIIGDVRVDGVANEEGISFLSMNDLVELDTFLQDHKSLLIVKLHPMDSLQKTDFVEFKNIIIIRPQDFKEQLYPLIGSSDYLLTDYSSVWIDYCILEKPIGFVMNDIEEYRNSRGLTLDDLDKKLPGDLLMTLDALKNFVKVRPYRKSEYMELYNTYRDNNSSERLTKILNL